MYNVGTKHSQIYTERLRKIECQTGPIWINTGGSKRLLNTLGQIHVQTCTKNKADRENLSQTNPEINGI